MPELCEEYGRVIYTLRTFDSSRHDVDHRLVERTDTSDQARNVYAAWARKLTNARPNDPKLQSYHQEVTKAGESVELLLVKLNVPLFRIPASEKELDRIVLRVKNRVSDPPAEKNEEEKKPAAVPPPPLLTPRSKGRKAKRSVDADGFAPPKQLVRKVRSPRSTPPPSPTPSSAPILDSATLEEQGEEGMDTNIDVPLSQEEVPVATKKPRIPPFFVSPKGDWRQLVALAKLIAPSFQSQMSGRFLKVTVADDVDYRALSKWLESSGVEFKSFMLKQDRPVKVVIRGLPSNTEPEEIKAEIEAEGFKFEDLSDENFRTKAPMPLFYLQIKTVRMRQKIYDFTEVFGTRIEVKPFDRGNKVNQCWRCQGWFHSSEVCHLPPRCVKCAGPHAAKDCTLEFNDPMKKPGLSRVSTPRSQTIVLLKTIESNFPIPQREAAQPFIVKMRSCTTGFPLPNLQGMDATAVQIKINNFPPINVVSAYVRRRAGHSFPVEDFKKIFNSGSNCIIAGDYNAAHVSWHNAKSTRFGQALHKLIRDLRGAKLVAPQTATHLQSRQRFGSVIDLAVFKHIPFNHSVRVINDLSSDHYPVILEINLNTSIIKNPEHLSTNWYNFKFALNKKPLPTVELTSNDNIELAISELNQNFTEAFVEASKPKFNNAPKILSPEIKFKIYQRNRLRKFWQRTRCPSIYSQFRTLSREIAKDIQAYSRVQWEKHIEALSPVDNTLWRKSSLLRKPFQSIPP
ncbi:nucleic-acid-binding protein from transposon X-element [Trichonephila clavipes]|nr:nucleic-acid-binding protein from transposon X-element [Trichonephila clavipes]